MTSSEVTGIEEPHVLRKKPLSKWAQIFVDIKVPELSSTSEVMMPNEREDVSEHDVLLGRGSASHTNTGNRHFRNMIASRLGEYAELPSRIAKSAFLEAIVADVQEKGGRFLQKDKESGEWIEVSDRVAREKAGHTVRDTMASQKRAEKTKKRKGKKDRKDKKDNKTIATPRSKPKSTPTPRKPLKPQTTEVEGKATPSEPKAADTTASNSALVLDKALLDAFENFDSEELDEVFSQSTRVSKPGVTTNAGDEDPFGLFSVLDDIDLDDSLIRVEV